MQQVSHPHLFETTIHEIGHLVSLRAGGGVPFSLGAEWLGAAGWIRYSAGDQAVWRKVPGSERPATTYGRRNPEEDFAEAFTVYVLNANNIVGRRKYPTFGLGPNRRQALLNALGRFK